MEREYEESIFRRGVTLIISILGFIISVLLLIPALYSASNILSKDLLVELLVYAAFMIMTAYMIKEHIFGKKIISGDEGLKLIKKGKDTVELKYNYTVFYYIYYKGRYRMHYSQRNFKVLDVGFIFSALNILQNYLKILIVMVDLTSIAVVIAFSSLKLDVNEIVELLKY